MPKLKAPKLEVANIEEETLEPIPTHPTWSGSISIDLVNIQVRAIPITLEQKISFRMLRQKCKKPIFCKLLCDEGDEDT
jgi:non-homologous end joining protein Ku